MNPESYVEVGNRRLRRGYTTGTCAAGAAKAAVFLLLTGTVPEEISVNTPKGITVRLRAEECERGKDYARCAVRKDSGDDPDVTNGILIFAQVRRGEKGVTVDGGEGIGRVTKPGLNQPIGAAAINDVPRRMICECVEQACEECGEIPAFSVEISIPKGKELASKTFNPRLGIVGGISVLGTSGIVEPMSESAIIETIRTEIRQRRAEGKKRIAVVPGNYGENFLHNTFGTDFRSMVQCSNFVGETLDELAKEGFEEILLVGHIGKLVKLAGGMFQTHSSNGDCRAEILTAYAAAEGIGAQDAQALLTCATAEDGLAQLETLGIREQVMDRLIGRISQLIGMRNYDNMRVGLMIYSFRHGVAGQTDNAREILERLKEV